MAALRALYIRHMSNETGGSRLSPERRREQIVEIAAGHFSRDGVADASMSAIATEAGVTRALVYHYFPGKGALLEAVLRREADRLLAVTAPESDRSPRENLERALVAFLDHFAASSGGVRELYVPTSATTSLAADLAAANHVVQVDRVLAFSRTPDTPETRIAVGAWLAFVEYAARQAAENPAVDRARLIEMCTTALEAVLGKPLP